MIISNQPEARAARRLQRHVRRTDVRGRRQLAQDCRWTVGLWRPPIHVAGDEDLIVCQQREPGIRWVALSSKLPANDT
jgi:hypothetical protein